MVRVRKRSWEDVDVLLYMSAPRQKSISEGLPRRQYCTGSLRARDERERAATARIRSQPMVVMWW
jgi:hypothetical protein